MEARSVIERLAELEREATEAPWASDPSDLNPETASVWAKVDTMPPLDGGDDWAWDDWYDSGGGRVCDVQWVDDEQADKDAALIIAARNALPALLAVARAARWLYDELSALDAVPTEGVADHHAGLGVLLARLDAIEGGDEK